MATIVAAAGGGNWNADGTWVGGVQPTAADDVQLDATSGQVTIPAATTAVCRSIDCLGYTSTLTFSAATSTLAVGDASGGNIRFVNTMNLTHGGGLVQMKATASATYTLTSGGRTLGNVQFGPVATSSTFQLADDLTLAGWLSHVRGTLDLNSKTVSATYFDEDSGVARTLTMGSAQITLNGSNPWSAEHIGGSLTVTANTATITFTSGFFTTGFRTGTCDFNGATLAFTSDGNQWIDIYGVLTVGNLTRTSSAGQVAGFTISGPGSLIVTGTLTLSGGSATSRLLFCGTYGTTRTVTVNGSVVASNVDFRDIAAAGSASWDLSAITGGSGDCLGNSGITFTTGASTTWTGTTGVFTWSTSGAGNWTGGRVPLPQDDAIIDTGSGAITMDMPRIGGLATAGTTRPLVRPSANFVLQVHRSLNLGYGTTTGGWSWQFLNRGASTLTCVGGSSTPQILVTCLTGTVTLLSTLNSNYDGGAIQVQSGTFDTNGQTVNALGGGTSTTPVTISAGATLLARTSTFYLWNNRADYLWNAASGAIVRAEEATINAGVQCATQFSAGGPTARYGTINFVGRTTGGPLGSPPTVVSSGYCQILNTSTLYAREVNVYAGANLVVSGTHYIDRLNCRGQALGFWRANVGGQNTSPAYWTVPDSTPLSPTGDLEIVMRFNPQDWTPAALSLMLAKWNGAAHRSYQFSLNTDGKLYLNWSADGTNALTATSSVATGITDGLAAWLRVTLDVDNGSGSREVKFYTCPDQASVPTGGEWTQLGTTQTGATTSVFDSDAALYISGRQEAGGGNGIGDYYRVIIYSDLVGTVAFDADFTTKTAGANAFTEGSVNAATVSIGWNGTCGDGSGAIAGSGAVTIVSPSAAYFGTHAYDGGSNVGISFGTANFFGYDYAFLAGITMKAATRNFRDVRPDKNLPGTARIVAPMLASTR